MAPGAHEHFIVMLPGKEGEDQKTLYTRTVESLGLRHAKTMPFRLPNFKVGTLDSLMEASDELAKVDALTEQSLCRILSTGVQVRLEEEDKSHTQKIKEELQKVKFTERKGNQSTELEWDVERYLQNWNWDHTRHTGVSFMPLKRLIEDLQKPVINAEDVLKKRMAEYAEVTAAAVAAERKVKGNLTVKDIREEVEVWNQKRSKRLPEELLRRKASECSSEHTQLCLLFVAVQKRDLPEWANYATWGITEEQLQEMESIKQGETDHVSPDGVSISQLRFKHGGSLVDTKKAYVTNPGGSQHGYGNSHDTGAPANVVDGTAETAWYDANAKPLIIDFEAPTPVDEFAFSTGTEAPHRDPVKWTLEGYTPAPAGTQVPSKTIMLEKAGQVVVSATASEHTTMTALHKKLEVPVTKRIQLQEDGMNVTAVYDQLEQGREYTYIVKDEPSSYDKNEPEVDLGTWHLIHETSQPFHTPEKRRDSTDFVRITSPGQYTKYRFTPTMMRGMPKRGPIPCGNGSVPNTSETVAEGPDHVLKSVMVFSKMEAQFKALCRDKKMAVREYEPVTENGTQTLTKQSEHQELLRQKADKRSNLLRNVQTQFSEAYAAWIHLKAMRAFVESLLRYGLPAHHIGVLFVVDAKSSKGEDEFRSKLEKLYAGLKPSFDLADDVNDTNALQEKYPYVSLRVPAVDC